MLALSGPVRSVATEPDSAIAALLAGAQGKFVAVAVVVVVVALAVAAPVAAGPVAGLAVVRVAARHPRPKYRSDRGVAAQAGKVKVLEMPAVVQAVVKAHRGSDAALAGSRRPTFRHPIACREEPSPPHLYKARTGL